MIEHLASLNTFFDELPGWLTAVTGLVTAASAISALTPTPRDDTFVARLRTVLEIVALNVGHARRK